MTTGMLVRSQFIVLIEEPGFIASFHTASGNYLVLTEEQHRMLLQDDCRVPLEQAGDLASYGFLIPAGTDELAAIGAVFTVASRRTDGVSLTIAPTMNCNFGCDYCFEQHTPGSMSAPVRSGTVEFARFLISRQPDALPLFVTWFGGEPLMALPVIQDLTRRFETFVSDGLCSGLQASVITNGYGLTPNVSAELIKAHVRDIQITLDGPPEVHDKRRSLKRGTPETFDRIVANILALPAELRVVIRMNVDRRNMLAAPALFEALESRGALRRVLVDLAEVENFSADANAVAPDILSSEEFSDFWRAMIALARSREWPMIATAPKPRIRGVCQVDTESGFVVDPSGELFRCWAELGNSGHTVGSVLRPSTWTALGHAGFHARDPFDDAECRSCALLPTCLGGCPILRDLRRRIGVKSCPPFKYHFDRLVLSTYGRTSRLVRPFDFSRGGASSPRPSSRHATQDSAAGIHESAPGSGARNELEL